MPSSTAMNFSEQTRPSSDREVWQSLKDAIANSSGFQRWLLERQLKKASASESTDQLVRSYLRETLETLAY
ncbi:MAG: hypothetical protein J7647_02900 [Cyanobacteria bacterium SBLK]|nr:hypothetical protein [Cyanobacteria bacterium SBLK]